MLYLTDYHTKQYLVRMRSRSRKSTGIIYSYDGWVLVGTKRSWVTQTGQRLYRVVCYWLDLTIWRFRHVAAVVMVITFTFQVPQYEYSTRTYCLPLCTRFTLRLRSSIINNTSILLGKQAAVAAPDKLKSWYRLRTDININSTINSFLVRVPAFLYNTRTSYS